VSTRPAHTSLPRRGTCSRGALGSWLQIMTPAPACMGQRLDRSQPPPNYVKVVCITYTFARAHLPVLQHIYLSFPKSGDEQFEGDAPGYFVVPGDLVSSFLPVELNSKALLWICTCACGTLLLLKCKCCTQTIAIIDPVTQTTVKNITEFNGTALLGPNGTTPRKCAAAAFLNKRQFLACV